MENPWKRRLTPLLIILLAVLLLIGYRLFTSKPAPPILYSIQEIQVDGFEHLSPLFINNQGKILVVAFGKKTGMPEILIFDPEANSIIVTGLDYHLTSTKGKRHRPKSFNDRGEIVGNVEIATNMASEGFLWSTSQGLRVLTPKRGGRFDVVEVNNRSDIAATWYSSDKIPHACLTNASGELKILGIDGPSGVFSLNDQGVVVGWKRDPVEIFFATIDNASDFNVQSVDDNSLIIARLNDAGDVVGHFEKAFEMDNYVPSDALYGNAQIGFNPLVGVSGKKAIASDINEKGQIVGYAFPARDRFAGSNSILSRMRMSVVEMGQTVLKRPVNLWNDLMESTALTWIDGGVYPLADLVEEKGEWLWLVDARGINDSGRIVGIGIRKDTPRGWSSGYLLTPIPDGD